MQGVGLASIPDFKALREAAKQEFLQEHGWGDASSERLNDAAKLQGFFRLRRQDSTRILWDLGAISSHDVQNTLHQYAVLNKAGLRTPDIDRADLEKNFILLEDFGTQRLSDLFAKDEPQENYLCDALDMLIEMQRNIEVHSVPQLLKDAEVFLAETALFTDWYWPALHGHETPPDLASEYQALWKKLFSDAPTYKTVSLAHYHAKHLMVLPQQLGLIHMRPAWSASPLYDVVTLLDDYTREVDGETALVLRRHYAAMQDKINVEDFAIHAALYAAQYHAKNMGYFIKRAVQNRNPVWLTYLPLITKYFDRALRAHPALQPLQKWFVRYSPNYNDPLPSVRLFKE